MIHGALLLGVLMRMCMHNRNVKRKKIRASIILWDQTLRCNSHLWESAHDSGNLLSERAVMLIEMLVVSVG